MYGWLGLGATLALIGAFLLGDHMGASRERDRSAAETAKKQDKTSVEVDRQAQASSEARTTMLDYLASIPKIEAKAHDAAERVRIIYKDRPLACVPSRPSGVREELDTAYRDTVLAISGLRRTTADSPANGP